MISPSSADSSDDDPAHGQAVLTPLAGPALLVTALAPDSLRLRRLLEAAYPTA